MAAREKTTQIRQHIIEATDDLLYRKGFNLMSFSDIANTANVPRGNLYYYFKTKNEVLDAVIKHRLIRTSQMLQDWDRMLPDPLERLKRFARIPVNEMQNIIQYGCPMGSLNTELGKVQYDLKQLSQQQFDVFRSWLVRQFTQWLPHANADALAIHLLVRTQGIATMAHVYEDPQLIEREVTSIDHWLESLADAS